MTVGRDTAVSPSTCRPSWPPASSSFAQDAGLTTPAWVARILASAVRSLKPRGNQ